MAKVTQTLDFCKDLRRQLGDVSRLAVVPPPAPALAGMPRQRGPQRQRQTSAGSGTSAGIRAKQCTTPVSNPLLCARICYLTAPTRTSLGFVFNTDYGCMMCRFQIRKS